MKIHYNLKGINNEYMKIKFNSGTSFSLPVTSCISPTTNVSSPVIIVGGNYGTTADNLTYDQLNGLAQSFTITISAYDLSGTVYYMVYMNGVMFCQHATSAACTFSGYCTSAITSLELSVAGNTLTGFYTTEKFIQ